MKLLLLATVGLAALGLGISSAVAGTSPIVGVWSFDGGQVAIQEQPGGFFTGTVVAPTKFAECEHETGETMWTNMTLQPDGSYWGNHQWFEPNCIRESTPGPTAWRYLENTDGSHYLLVCFSHPKTTQPTISADGSPGTNPSEYAAHNVTYGCFKSKEIAPLPGGEKENEKTTGTTGTGTTGTTGTGKGGVESFAKTVSLPSAKQCLSGRSFKIHVKNPAHDPLNKVTVQFPPGHKLVVKRHGNTFATTISLKGLPTGTFTVKITAITVLGNRLTGKRTYHTCAPKKRHHKPGKLKSARP